MCGRIPTGSVREYDILTPNRLIKGMSTNKFKTQLATILDQIVDQYDSDEHLDDLTVTIRLNKQDGVGSVTSVGGYGESRFPYSSPQYLQDPSNEVKKPKSFQQVLDMINGHTRP